MKIWKRNAIIATVLLFVCAGIYLNWAYNSRQPTDLTETLNAEQVLGEDTLVMSRTDEAVAALAGSDASSSAGTEYFAQVRLSRQEARDRSVELLEQTIACDDGTALGTSASDTLNTLVSDALSEAQIESLVIAKGYADCVAYINDGTVSVAVSAPVEGLSEADVALISDVVTGQTDYNLSQVRIVEVKS